MTVQSLAELQPGALIQLRKDPMGLWSWPFEADTLEAIVLRGEYFIDEYPSHGFVDILWGTEIFHMSIIGVINDRVNWVITKSHHRSSAKTWVYSVCLLTDDAGTP